MWIYKSAIMNLGYAGRYKDEEPLKQELDASCIEGGDEKVSFTLDEH
jgi:hypothetical protein